MATILPFPGNNGDSGQGDGTHTGSPTPDKQFPGLFGKDLGLEVSQIEALLSGDPEQWSGLFSIVPDLTGEEAQSVPVFVWTRALLETVRINEPVKATAKGNLPPKLVKELFQGAFSDAEPDFIKVNREDDSPVLVQVRRLAQDAGLLLLRSKTFRVTKAGAAALDGSDHNEIFRRLLEAFLRKPERLEQYDRYPQGGVTIKTVPIMLFAARHLGSPVLYEEDFSDLLYSLFNRPPDTDAVGETLDRMIQLRFFTRFGIPFGFFREMPPFQPPVQIEEHYFDPHGRWTRTPFHERILRWHVAPPEQPFPTPEMAAYYHTEAAHESPHRIDGSENWHIRMSCIRAIERCPHDADAWVVWARLFEHKPAISLEIVENGLAATADRRPEVPDDVSPWADHLYRDVIRLHFIRATALLALGRRDGAFEEFEQMLRSDPEDGINAAAFYVPALIEAGRYSDAQRVHARYRDDYWADGFWTAALIAWALGEREQARAELDRAFESNHLVAEMLVHRWLPETGGSSHYTAGSEDEAIAYAERTGTAWRRVPGAREWLQRQVTRRNRLKE